MKPSYKRALSLLVAPLCLAFALAPRADAGVGQRLEQAKQTDFFKFFALVEDGTAEPAPGGLTTANFRPRAGQFRQLVKVSLTLDSGGVIRAAELAIERSFVDDPFSGIFARDIAKSFIRFAVPPGDEHAINDLANEIEFPKESGAYDTVRVAPGSDPKLPAQPTKGYLVYLGKQPLFQQALAKSTLRMENVRAAGKGAVLHISVGAPKGRGAT